MNAEQERAVFEVWVDYFEGRITQNEAFIREARFLAGKEGTVTT